MNPRQRIVAATANPGKLEEIRRLLADLPIEVVGLDSFPGFEPAEETGSTYRHNALAKARQAARFTGLPCIADDSGLEVDALDGAPGIHSARFDGPSGTARSRNAKLLDLLSGVDDDARTARFRAVVALVWPEDDGDPSECIFSGRFEGVIARQPSGAGGFGYDPIFHVPSLGCTVAELAPEHKDRLSHRGQALGKLARHLAARVARP